MRFSVALAAAFFTLAAPAALAQAPRCQLVRIAEWPVRLQGGGHPVIEGEVNGRKVGILLDTGATVSVIMKSSTEKLGLNPRFTMQRLEGIGGETQVLVAMVDELKIAGAVRDHIRLRVAGERPFPGIDVVLGDDFFRHVDLEFDYARGVVRLFEPVNCRDSPLAYWDPGTPSVAMESDDRIVIPVKVNGRKAYALLDSGAHSSVVDTRFAARVDVTPNTPGVIPSSCTGGFGADLVKQWLAHFDAIEVGPEIVHDPRLEIMEIFQWPRPDAPEVILGADFLRSHRIFVSRAQRKVYFSYAGGQVFPATPGLQCDDDLRRDTSEEDLDHAIAADPKNAKALLRRALRRSAKNPAGALADLDEVIRLEPANGVAYQARMQLRASANDLAGALADSDAALSHGMRSARLHSFRSGVFMRMHDSAHALHELDEAVLLDPRDEPILRYRGRLHFDEGRFEAAENDFKALLALRPSPLDPVWYAIARERRGLEARAALEAGLAKLSTETWPAPVLRYLLGTIDEQALMAAAATGDEKKRREQQCEARFYAAERFLAKGRRDEARPLLENARDECPRDFIEYHSAVNELAAFR